MTNHNNTNIYLKTTSDSIIHKLNIMLDELTTIMFKYYQPILESYSITKLKYWKK